MILIFNIYIKFPHIYIIHNKLISENIIICLIRLPIPVSAMYIREHFKVESKRSALEMVSQIRSQFKLFLESIEWMDEQTREIALKKLKNMESYIGYPDELMDEEKVEEEMKDLLHINVHNFYESSFKILKYTSDKSNGDIRKPSNKFKWTDIANSAFINAHYYINKNSIGKKVNKILVLYIIII